MKIAEWENYVFKKYKAIKLKKFNELKQYLTRPNIYEKTKFDPYTITEGDFLNNEYYGTYIFNDSLISGRLDLKINQCASWITTFCLISSHDRKNIDDIYFHSSMALTDTEFSNFLKAVTPKDLLEKSPKYD